MRPERVGLEAYAAAYGTRLERGVAVLRVDGAAESPMVNRLVGLGDEEPATEAALDAGIAALEGTRFYVSRSPSAQPVELDDWLRARGFEPGWGWMQFTRPGELAPPEVSSSLRVVEVDDERRAEDFARLVRMGYGLPEPAEQFLVSGARAPGWTAFLALERRRAGGRRGGLDRRGRRVSRLRRDPPGAPGEGRPVESPRGAARPGAGVRL